MHIKYIFFATYFILGVFSGSGLAQVVVLLDGVESVFKKQCFDSLHQTFREKMVFIDQTELLTTAIKDQVSNNKDDNNSHKNTGFVDNLMADVLAKTQAAVNQINDCNKIILLKTFFPCEQAALCKKYINKIISVLIHVPFHAIVHYLQESSMYHVDHKFFDKEYLFEFLLRQYAALYKPEFCAFSQGCSDVVQARELVHAVNLATLHANQNLTNQMHHAVLWHFGLKRMNLHPIKLLDERHYNKNIHTAPAKKYDFIVNMTTDTVHDCCVKLNQILIKEPHL